MFCKNDYVNYRTQGVCKIEEIRFIQFDPLVRDIVITF